MALKRSIPDFELGYSMGEGALKPVPRVRGPVSLSFRSGADLEPIVASIAAGGSFLVDAAPGAGKTTTLPRRLAAALDLLIVHVFPSEFHAADAYDYEVSVGRAAGLVFVEKPADPFPVAGRVMISAAVLVAKWLESARVTMPRCVLYHDESHESDFSTYVVKTLAPTCEAVKAYVQASATISPTGFRGMEAPGEVVKKEFPAASLVARPWDVYDTDAPWAVERFVGHVLIFEDDVRHAESMVTSYNQAGCTAFRMHGKMPLARFRGHMKALRGNASGICVVVADSTFRSGFTFPVTMVIDSGEVGFVNVVNGKPVNCVRKAYELELHQAACRGGRVSGLRTESWRPGGPYRAAVCDLEPADMEACALVFRLVGYCVPRVLGGCAMAVGKVPRDVSSALRGSTPLAQLVDHQLVEVRELTTESGRRSPFLKEGYSFNKNSWDFQNSNISADLARRERASSVERIVETAAPRVAAPVNDAKAMFENAGHALNSFLGSESVKAELDMGKYYYAEGVEADTGNSYNFPEGADSVYRVFRRDKSGALFGSLSPEVRGNALWLILMRYNTQLCELKSLAMAVTEAKDLAAGKDSAVVRAWASRCAERMTELSEYDKLSRQVLGLLSEGFCVLKEYAGFAAEEVKLKQYFLAEVVAAPAVGVGAPVGMVRGVVDWASESSSSGGFSAPLEYVAMPVRGRGSRAVSSKAVSTLAWVAGARRGAVVARKKPK